MSVQPTQSAMPQGLVPAGLGSQLSFTGHCLEPRWEKAPPNVPFITGNAIQSAIYHTKDLTRSSVCLFAAGRAARQAGPWSIVSSLWNNARAYPSPLIGQANLVPENPNNAANLQRKIKQRGFCFLSSSALLSTGEDLGFRRSPGYSFHAGAEP